jgi:hypothetical protein
MVMREGCPRCMSSRDKKNGHMRNSKENHCCHDRGRPFVQCCEALPDHFHCERAAELRDKMKSAGGTDDMDNLWWTLFCPFP